MGLIQNITGFFGKKDIQVKNMTNLKANKASSVISYEQPLTRAKQDVGKWRRAVIVAESIINPSRVEYYRLLKDVVIDSHLSAVMEQRKNAVLCRDIIFYNKDGTVNEDKTKIFKSEWFNKLSSFALDSKYYGFSLVDLGPLIDDKFPKITIVPRQYVKPEFGIVVSNTANTTGVSYEDPKYAKWNIFFGETHDLGLLMKAGPWAIWKKTVTAYWSEYCEKFGVPMRVGKTNVMDETLKNNMENALKNMGSAFYAILGENDELEVIESFKVNAYDVFDKFIERSNSEFSKLIVGQTGTSDEKSFVGSANVHKGVLADIVEADCTWLCNNLNEKVLPVLNMHGFALDGYFGIDYKEVPSLEAKAKIVSSFMPYVEFNKEYLESEFGIIIENVGAVKSQDGGTGEKKPKTNYQNIINNYNTCCKTCGGIRNEDFKESVFTDAEEEMLIMGVLNGIYDVDQLPEWYYYKISDYLLKSVKDGFGEIMTGQSVDTELLAELNTNTYVFSAAKTYQQVRDIKALVIKYKDQQDLFMKEAKLVFENYNKNWLATEYYNAKSTARSAKNWNAIERDKNILKYLEYSTVGDSRVRPTHQELDGITRPVNDAFWDNYYPPNGWRCRCTTISHEDVTGLTPMKGFKQPEDVPDLFLFNAGKDRIIFSPEHPYFTVAKGDKKLALNNFNLPLP